MTATLTLSTKEPSDEVFRKILEDIKQKYGKTVDVTLWLKNGTECVY